MQRTFYVQYAKRWFDVIVSLGGLLLVSPFLLLVAIAVRLDSPGPSFFRQERTGKCGRTFRIIKFRTMRLVVSGDAPLITASGDSRVTRIGRWLRKTKVDELPQLFNVILGEMSLVGPRPEVPMYTRLYNQAQTRVLEARPGITGPAAIACANEEEILAQQPDPESYYVGCLLPLKLELDLAYCAKVGFSKDVSLIAQTLKRLLHERQSKIDLNDEVTTEGLILKD